MVKNKSFPSLPELELIRSKIKNIPNQRGEFKRPIHYGCYLLCSESGLRISEAVKFDLRNKTKQDLYRISKPKRKKERLVYVSKEVIRELKKQNWKPNQTNRHNFYHFLKKIKREMNISPKIELTPHTLRRAFATHHAEAGLPLPLLSKLLGHSSIRTTALYWRNVYGGDDDISGILAGKKWLEKSKEPPLPENSVPIRKNLEPVILKNKPVISPERRQPFQKPTIKPNSPPPIKIEPKPIIINSDNEIPPQSLKQTSNNHQPTEISKPLPVKPQKEQILLKRISELEEQLKIVQAENKQLKTAKEQAEVMAKQEKERADNYEKQLKAVAKTFYQWCKIKYYQQLEQERKAQVEQPFKPPPFKVNK